MMIYNKPKEITITPPKTNDEFYLMYLESSSGIDRLFDQLVPRNNVRNSKIVIEKQEYLSRLSTLKRKYLGVEYRYENWRKVVEVHNEEFKDLKERFRNLEKLDKEERELENTRYSRSSGFAKRDLKVENEFEVFISSVSSLLDVLVRFIASFLKGSESCHSISKIEKILKNKQGFKKIYNIISVANKKWLNELKVRRDSSTHYIMISAHSKYSYTQELSEEYEKTIKIGIPQYPIKGKSVSIWDEDIPVIGGHRMGSCNLKTNEENEIEEHEIFDATGRSIYRYNGRLYNEQDLIDGETYLKNIMKNLDAFIFIILRQLSKKVKCV